MFAKLRSARIVSRVDDYTKLFESSLDTASWQLQSLNDSWRSGLEKSDATRQLQKLLGLPASFSSWEQLAELVPFTDKGILRDALGRSSFPSDMTWRGTGGTTSQPFRFPSFAHEPDTASLDIWLGRKWLGVPPSERLFLIWGHSHLLGSGLKSKLLGLKRKLSDRALGYTRFSAYQLDDASLLHAGELLLGSGAGYVLGYSVAIDRFCRVNSHRTRDFHKLRLKAVITTAEGLPQADSRKVIEACLGCRLSMEYGSMETGPIAYEVEQDRYCVFWPHHRIDTLPLNGDETRREVLVTCLFPRALPLIRYKIGDILVRREGVAEQLEFSKIIGRCNDSVDLPDGSTIHSEAFTHCIRDCPGIAAFQIKVGEAGTMPILLFESRGEVAASDLQTVRDKLSRVHPLLAQVQIERRERLEQSQAGKHSMVVRPHRLAPESRRA